MLSSRGFLAAILLCAVPTSFGCDHDRAHVMQTGSPANAATDADDASSDSVDENGESAGSDDTQDAAGEHTPVNLLSIPCNDARDALYGNPGALGTEPGAILKCSTGELLPRSLVQEHTRDITLTDGILDSGARVYRIAYRTERATRPPTPGYSVALVLMPDTPRAQKLPILSVAHGTAGQAPQCAGSHDDMTQVKDSFTDMILPLVGSGFAVIASDYAGYSNFGAAGNPPSGYAFSDDAGKSILDAARALRKLAPERFSDDVVLIGHSQGGHSALSALALSDTYGAGGTIKAAVTYSPLWLNEASWGAMLLLSDQYPTSTEPFKNAVGLWYHYSHAYLLDGPEHALDIFRAEKHDLVRHFFDNVCNADVPVEIQKVTDQSKNLYTPDFASAVMVAAAIGTPCLTDTCTTWTERYAADRPHLTGRARSVPLLIAYGGQDTTIPKDRMACAIERLDDDAANYQVCYEPTASHVGIVQQAGGHVAQWIAHLTLGEPAPAACTAGVEGLDDLSGKRIACATPPPND
jgi:pimeloyl-ACP methyl ester carboxylesterase